VIEVRRHGSSARETSRRHTRISGDIAYRGLNEVGTFCKRLSIRYRASGSDSDSPASSIDTPTWMEEWKQKGEGQGGCAPWASASWQRAQVRRLRPL